MSEVVLKIEHLSKQYRLGKLGTGTVSHDINRWWHKIRGKEDPYLKIGDVNDRTNDGGSEYVWSLRDINFEIKKGEVLGIIGKNGAGKSTLLKILSQITPPTLGEVKVKGRIAALLEVGTGFHPELSGKENIFLNGAILGMTKTEIKSKLDEIVEFSGVAKYIDTPVKRYSSGMMVRLGFAVAAHLEPEILIVDEVLAVGDSEFQEKCLGKMKDVSSNGRTVLFVSHNLGSVSELCSKGMLLENGNMAAFGEINDIISQYSNKNNEKRYVAKSFKDKEVYFKELEINKSSEANFKVIINGLIINNSNVKNATIGILITDSWGQKISTVMKQIDFNRDTFETKIYLEIDMGQFRNGKYFFDAALFIPKSVTYEYIKEAISVEIEIPNELLIGVFDATNIGPLNLNTRWHIA